MTSPPIWIPRQRHSHMTQRELLSKEQARLTARKPMPVTLPPAPWAKSEASKEPRARWENRATSLLKLTAGASA